MPEFALWAATGMAGLAFLLALWRFLRGPHGVDRVVGFDGLTIVSIALIVLAALLSGRELYLDVALVYALLSFLSVLIAARYFEKGEA